MSSYIKHISYFLPDKIFSNTDFFDLFPESKNNNSYDKLGIEQRHIIDRSNTASDIAILAAEKLFKEYNIDRNEIDYLLFCAQEFDYYTPTTACVIQNRLNLPKSVGALDFNLGCTGFLYGLSLAKGLIDSNQAKNVLFLTSSTLTKTFHEKDKSSRFIFGDGAAATLVSKSETKQKIQQFIFGTDGSRYDKIIVKDGRGRNEISANSFEEKEDNFGNIYSDGNFYMDGMSIFNFSLNTVPNLVKETLYINNLDFEDIDLFIFHQPNEFLLKVLQKKLGIPDEKFIIFMKNIGNTVSSTIPIALHHAIKSNKAKNGDTIMLVAFGVGLSWAGTVIKL